MNIKTVDIPIGGKLVVYRESISQHTVARADSDSFLKTAIKQNIANQIALYMLDNNLIEINLRDDPNTLYTEIIARVCIVPDDKIRIVRTMI
jgi:hypothetical protein